MEMFPIEGAVPRLIENGAGPDELIAASRAHGMITLWEAGLARYWRGATSLEEIRRVIGETQGREAASGDADVRPRGPRAPGALRILLADDDAAMRRLLRTVLEREGFDVLEATDGLETLDAIEGGNIDLVILDHDMPNLTGIGVLEEMRARLTTSQVPVIMLTARTDDTELEALELGAQDFLTKPVQPRSLVARVRAVLKRQGVD
jgi:CheY-like chemotaxis protein